MTLSEIRCYLTLRREGQPCLKGSFTEVETIIARLAAGESVGVLAKDYDTTARHIEAAVRLFLRAAVPRGITQRVYVRMQRMIRQ